MAAKAFFTNSLWPSMKKAAEERNIEPIFTTENLEGALQAFHLDGGSDSTPAATASTAAPIPAPVAQPGVDITAAPVQLDSITAEPNIIKVVNDSRESVVVWVTEFNKSSVSGPPPKPNGWKTIKPGSASAWDRPGKSGEYVMMRPVVTEVGEAVFTEPYTTTVGVFVLPGVIVRVSGLSHPGVVVSK